MNEHVCKDCIIKSEAAKNLNSEEIYILEKNSVHVTFKKGEMLFKQGVLSSNVIYLKSGIAKLHIQGLSKEKILRVVKAKSFLGLPTTFGIKANQFSATALVDCSVCFIDSDLFRSFIFGNGKFAYEIIVELCKNELYGYERSLSLSHKQIPGLVAEALLCFSDKIFEKQTFNFPLTRIEMGNLIGTSRESVCRALTDFNNEKIIEINGNKVTILNKEMLIQISKNG